MPSKDTLHRFLFENADIRGEVITLNRSYSQVIQGKNYPGAINLQLGEFLAAAGLLSATLKFNGTISLQAHSLQNQGTASLLMADCTRHHNLRGIARLSDNATFNELNSLGEILGNGTLAITIEPDDGERYQGLVPLESKTLAQALEFYFEQSEQLKTRFWFFSDNSTVSALLLQQMPHTNHSSETNLEAWERITHLAETITADELLSLPHDDVLYRLFHEEQVRLFEPKKLQFSCSCSRDRTATAIKSLGKAEFLSILEEQEKLEIQCEFCHQRYQFDTTDLESLFGEIRQTLH